MRRQMGVFAALGVTLALGLSAGVPAHAQEDRRPVQVSKDTRSIAVTATDRVMNQADLATVHVGFVLYGADRDAAYSNGSRASNAIKKALLDLGIPDDQIQSEDQNLSPVSPDEVKPLPAEQRAARAFALRQSWTVRVDAKDANRALDAAVHAGANQSGQIEWSLRDPNAVQAAAAAKAIQRARTQAQAMASGLSVKLGALLYASDEVNAGPLLLRAPQAMAMRMEKAPAAPLAINPQQIETSATVYAVFAIE